MTTCFVAGIVKGLVENNDAYRHFGSLAAFRSHLSDAVAAGLVTPEKELTEQGRAYYSDKQLSTLKDTRAYCWNRERDW